MSTNKDWIRRLDGCVSLWDFAYGDDTVVKMLFETDRKGWTSAQHMACEGLEAMYKTLLEQTAKLQTWLTVHGREEAAKLLVEKHSTNPRGCEQARCSRAEGTDNSP